jgi:hypothetical protein
MPRRLLARCHPDSIREFGTSAIQRYNDGIVAAGGGRSLAAIYLWGYAAEMILKTAYFSAAGIGEATTLEMNSDIKPAINLGKSLGVSWPAVGQGHNVRAWAELLILERATHPNPPAAYNTGFERAIQACGQRISQLWSETLRYHKNTPYPHEIRQIREATEWLLVHAQVL